MSTITAGRIAAALGLPEPTDEQTRVIEHPPGPLLVVAGAGSGKTETMAARVVWLVANGHVAADQVLGLTFTRKAAAELGRRISVRLQRLRSTGLVEPAGDVETIAAPTVSTYHAYAGRLVREHGLRLGIEPDSRLLSEAAAWQLAHEVVTAYDGPLEQVGRTEPTITRAVVALSGEMAEHLVGADALADWHERILGRIDAITTADKETAAARDLRRPQAGRQALIPVLRRFAEVKRQRSALDFADQMSLAARLVQRFPEVGALERARFGAVLLDEFQDTSHAQLTLLRSLFAGADAVPVTAVGDPFQSIYAWRGASAETLAAYPTAFAGPAGPAPVLPLSTTWRNDRRILEAANIVAGPLRRRSGVQVRPLRADALTYEGRIECARTLTVEDEAERVAGWIEAQRAGGERSAAILCRKRAQFPPLVAALTARGVPFEVVGLGGLLQTPEVADVVALLTIAHDASRGDRLMRLLTGPVCRLGAADLDAFAAWARAEQRPVRSHAAGPPSAVAAGADLADASGDRVSLVEALVSFADLPPHRRERIGVGEVARERLLELSGMVARIRRSAGHSLAELVGDAERLLGLDVEVLARPGFTPASARAHLDAFADVAAGFSDSGDRPTLGGFLAWLDAAQEEERGLERGTIELAPGAVHVLTVHAAKGLEWDAVAVPGLVEGNFPAHESHATWNPDTSRWVVKDPNDHAWTRRLEDLPYDLRGDRGALATFGWAGAQTSKELEQRRAGFAAAAGADAIAEERRLAYVALTRARHRMLLTGAVWGTQIAPRPASRFVTELTTEGSHLLDVREWIEDPVDGGIANPRLAAAVMVEWPAARSASAESVARAAVAVRAAAEAVRAAEPDARTRGAGLPADVALLLAERREEAERRATIVEVPRHLATSDLVALATDADAFLADLRRPMPAPPHPSTRRGTAFHAWIERRYRRAALIDPEDLPGSADPDTPRAYDLDAMIRHFEASSWAALEPLEVELAVETVIDGIAIRGRIDAVFARPEGGVCIVDWKSGRPPTGPAAAARAVQLAAYRIAYARLRGLDEKEVKAAFYYATSGVTVYPELPSTRQLRGLLAIVSR